MTEQDNRCRCGAPIEADHVLCSPCWRRTPSWAAAKLLRAVWQHGSASPEARRAGRTARGLASVAVVALVLASAGCDMGGRPAEPEADAEVPDGGGSCAAYFTTCVDLAGEALAVDLDRLGAELAWSVYDAHLARCTEGRQTCSRWPATGGEP